MRSVPSPKRVRFLLLIAIVLLSSLSPGQAVADHGVCTYSGTNYWRGGLRKFSNTGVGATIEWDEPATPCVSSDPNAPNFSMAWPMAAGEQDGKTSLIQAGWFKRNTSETEMFIEWKLPGEGHRRRYYGFSGTIDLRFIVERDEAYCCNTWGGFVVRPSDGARQVLDRFSGLITPMDEVQVFAETNRTTQRLWGRPADRAYFRNFRYDPTSGGWTDILLDCTSVGGLSHYRLDCGPNTYEDSFYTYDDRR